MKYICPVCRFDGLDYPPDNFNICPSCGTEFGVDDEEYTIQELTDKWIQSGKRWWSLNIPNPKARELINIDSVHISTTSQTTGESTEIPLSKKTDIGLFVSSPSAFSYKGRVLLGGIVTTSSRDLKYVKIFA